MEKSLESKRSRWIWKESGSGFKKDVLGSIGATLTRGGQPFQYVHEVVSERKSEDAHHRQSTGEELKSVTSKDGGVAGSASILELFRED